MTTPLCELGKKYGTDKNLDSHQYTPHYHNLFRDKTNVRVVLEIGIGEGGSLKMWRDYFPMATIYGIDNAKEKIKDYGERIIALEADQHDKGSLLDAIQKIESTIDIVIDDGDHTKEGQMCSLQTIYPLLSRDGIYIIEDIQKLEYIIDIIDEHKYLYQLIQTKLDGDNKLLIVYKNEETTE